MTSDMTSEEQPVKMTGQEDNNAVRMAGYLDKRGKMKLVTTWKRYWFVLKDQLLLYYKSEAECLNLSACRGSLNMGLVSSVRPGAHRGPPATAAQGFTIEVETRTQVVVLRTKHRNLQEQWLKALLESMALPNISTPVRTGGGPVHFRYSMENLPVTEEAKTEDKKEQTLPHQTSVTSQDTVLGRIKRTGGQSYGGSLDTILRHKSKTQVQPQWSPQQPKIPRIKAVDRMLGVQYSESTENTKILTSESQIHGLVNEERCPSDSTCSASKDEVLMPNGREEIKCNEVSLHRPVATSSDTQEVRETNFKLRGDEMNKQNKVAIFARGENKNHEKLNIINIEKARKYTSDFLENERYVYSLEKEEEILVENKLYMKTKAVENEYEDKIYEETKEVGLDCSEVENKLYEKNEPDKESKQYDSLEELSFSHVSKIPEDEKMYDDVSVSVDAVKQVEGDVHSLEYKEEDDYYCSYDRFSLMRLLSDQCNSSSPEPDLPPRPSVGSIDSPKSHFAHENTKTDDDEAEYSVYYESTESYNTNTSPSHLLLSNGVGSEKKGSKLRVRMKLRKKKSPSKKSVSSEDLSNNNNKRKRKMSFLRRILKPYRKKPQCNSEAVVNSDSVRISAEPEYATVDYLASVFKHEVTEEELPEHGPRSKSTESLDKAVLKEKLFGTKNLLTEQAMNELKMKLKCRDNAAQIEPPVCAKEENKRHEVLSPNEILEKKPIPTPRSNKESVNQDNKDLVVVSSRYRCNDSITRENKPPSLPPRRVARPRSPWHDVPKNNSPFYGNFQVLSIITGDKKEDKNEESPESTFETQSAPPLSEMDQDFQDKLLGTPRGFVYVQNKWKTAEKSTERFHDQQGNKGKSSFQKSLQKEFLPEKCNNTAEVEVKHVRTASSDHARSDILGYEHKTDSVLVVNVGSSDICSDVYKELSSVNIITKDLNSQTEKLTAKDDDLSDTYSQMADNELSCEKGEGPKVPKNDVELRSNGNIKVKVRCSKTEHSDTYDNRIVNNNGDHKNFELNTTHHEDFLDDVSVTLRKSQTDTISVCNRSEILCNETKKCLELVSGENENFSSSLCHNAGVSTDLKEEAKDEAHITINDCVCSDSSSISTDSLVREEIKTLCNTACSQKILLNGMAKNFSDRALDTTETAGYKNATPHLHRHSDELNILLAQLAEITSAPLMPHGVTSSLVDIPEARNPKPEATEPLQLDSTQQELVQKELL